MPLPSPFPNAGFNVPKRGRGLVSSLHAQGTQFQGLGVPPSSVLFPGAEDLITSAPLVDIPAQGKKSSLFFKCVTSSLFRVETPNGQNLGFHPIQLQSGALYGEWESLSKWQSGGKAGGVEGSGFIESLEHVGGTFEAKFATNRFLRTLRSSAK